jgi:hypothetical protein
MFHRRSDSLREDSALDRQGCGRLWETSKVQTESETSSIPLETKPGPIRPSSSSIPISRAAKILQMRKNATAE